MTIKKCLCVLVALALFVFSCNEEESYIAEEVSIDESLIPDQYIVILKEKAFPSGRTNEPIFTDRAEKLKYSKEIASRVSKELNSFYNENRINRSQIKAEFTSLYSGFVANLNKEELSMLQNDPRVDFVEQDRMVKLDVEVEAVYTEDELSAAIRGSRTQAQTTTCAIDNASGFGDGSGKQTFIWIVDTGIDLDHPDLNVEQNFSRSFADSSPDDSNGHGTHVAGIAAAINNSIGVVGVSAGAPVVAVDVLGSGSAPASQVISGLNYIASNDISGDVVNMSLGPRSRTGCSSTSAYRTALVSLNDQSFIALAAGNSSDDASFYDPACHNLSRVFTVASMTCSGQFSSFSNFGSPVDWIATGSSVTSTYLNGGYATISGTSMASPVVAGILHDRNAAPSSCGSVSFNSSTYSIACR